MSSSPINIPRLADSMSSPGLYIPVHKRTGSSSSSSGLSASPVSSHGLRHNVTDSKPTTPPPRSYTAELLLALRPNAIESMKERVRASCPEIVMSRRVRKAVEYHERQYTKIQRSNDPVSQEDRHPIVIDKHAHLPLSVSSELPRTRAPRDAPAQTHVPRSSNPPERRRNAPQSFYTPGATRTWRGMDVSSLTPLRLTLG